MVRLIHQVLEYCMAKENICMNYIWPLGCQFTSSAVSVPGGVVIQAGATDRDPHFGDLSTRKCSTPELTFGSYKLGVVDSVGEWELPLHG